MLGIKLSALIIGTMASITSIQPQKEIGFYPMTTIVSDVYEIETETEKEYQITIEDFNGNEWVFISEDGDWVEGDIASVIMSDNRTEEIEDDQIIDVKYSGWFEGWTEKGK